MTTFLWVAVILMAAALLAEIFAFVGMAMVATRAARRGVAVATQLKERIEPTVQLAKELQQSLHPRLEAITRQGQEMATLVAVRSESLQAAFADTSQRAERIRLRLMEGVQTVQGQPAGRPGIYRGVVEPIQTARHVVRGLKIALWILRKVA
jgi:hypothetical protein